VAVAGPKPGWKLGRSASEEPPRRYDDTKSDAPGSIEETSLAIAALASFKDNPAVPVALERGLSWLTRSLEDGTWRSATPIGLYFARLWYYEDLYPIVFSVEALGRYLRRCDQEEKT